MAVRRLRTLYYLVGLVAVTVAFTLVYNYGMATWEGSPQPLYRSLEVVIQTFTTTGYGEDAPWSTPQMHALVIGMQLTGVGLILAAADVFVVPWLRAALSATPPTSAENQTNHAIVCEFTPRGEAFVEELADRDREYTVVVSDRDRALELEQAGHPVVHGNPEEIEVLKNANVTDASAVIADASDERNASIILAASEAAADVPVYALVEDPDLAPYHRIAGAAETLSPRQLLGRSLARQMPTVVTTDLETRIRSGETLDLVEMPVRADSELTTGGYDVDAIHRRTGARVIGAWVDGDFVSPYDPDGGLEPGGTLLVAGRPEDLSDLTELAADELRQPTPTNVIIAGMGRAGAAAETAISGPGAHVTVLDIEDKSGVDIVGDARDPDALQAAGLAEASALVLTLSDDTATIFATLVARDRNPDLRILVRANDHDSVRKLYRAGADHVESLDSVSGRMLVRTIFEEGVEVAGEHVDVVERTAGDLAGQTIAEAAVREETGCTVVAVEREETVITDFDPVSFRLQEDDCVVVAGTERNIDRFDRQFSAEQG
jgi:Trk K+ transport system NAD-binding subunit